MGGALAKMWFLMNGIEYTGTSQLGVTPGGVSGELLGIDAVREFNVLTDTYSAEYGKRAGAQVSVVTQSGSECCCMVRRTSLFGTTSWMPADFFDQGASAPPFRRNQFGASLGGPIKKDKLFLFGNYEGFRQSLAATSVSVVPDANARNGIIRMRRASPRGREREPGDEAILALWPAPNGPELLSHGCRAARRSPTTTRESASTKTSGLCARITICGEQRYAFGVKYTIDNGNSSDPGGRSFVRLRSALRNQVASLDETHMFSPRI